MWVRRFTNYTKKTYKQFVLMYFGDTHTCILKNAVVTVCYNKAVLFVSLVLFPVIHHLCGLTWGWNLGSNFER